MPPEQLTGTSSVSPIVEVTLRLSGSNVDVVVDRAASELGDEMAARSEARPPERHRDGRA